MEERPREEKVLLVFTSRKAAICFFLDTQSSVLQRWNKVNKENYK